MNTKTVRALIFLSAASFGLQTPALSDQGCGTSVGGGIIGPGTYVGTGDSCKTAKADLKAEMGMTNPVCEGCPPEEIGCLPGTIIPDESHVDTGNCHWDDALQKFIVVADVDASTSWDKVCSSCW